VRDSVAVSFRVVSLACAALALAASGCAALGDPGRAGVDRAVKRDAA
jgi:hypothetical protein